MPYVIGSNQHIDTDTYLKEYYGLINKNSSVKSNDYTICKNEILEKGSSIHVRSGEILDIKIEIFK